MKRQLMLAVSATLAMLTLVGLTGTAHADTVPTPAAVVTADCLPGNVSDYPPANPEIDGNLRVRLSGGHLLPGTSGNRLVVEGGESTRVYCGMLYSTPVELGAVAADDDGTITWDGVPVPADFKLDAVHHLDVYESGSLVGAFDFCVDQQGALVSTSSCGASNVGATSATTVAAGTAADHGKASGALPRTGWDHLLDVLKAAAVAFALGALFLYLRRRRTDGIAGA